MKFETRAVHVGVNKDSAYNSCITPIYPSSTFYWDDLETNRGFDYTRSGNPTRKAMEENIAALEGGIDCKATCTGMAAITAARALQFTTPVPTALAGGVLVHGRGVRRAFTAALEAAEFEFRPVQLVAEPAQGAIVLARRMSGALR